MMKICPSCKIEKDETRDYYQRNGRPHTPCKDCKRARGLEYHRIRDEIRIQSPMLVCTKCKREMPNDQFYKSSSWCRECHKERLRSEPVKERRRGYKKNDPIAYMLYAAKNRAKEKGLPFTISKADISIPTHCPALGIPLEPSAGLAKDNSPSLDRIDSSAGYEPGNVAVISARANKLKNDSTSDELYRVAFWVRSMEERKVK
jgi:hypothetical protein